jgi:Holliday junction resolvase RusA-like endonuclease
MNVNFRVYGTPKGQPRTKACIRGTHASVYTPTTADQWKLAVQESWREVCGHPTDPATCAILLNIIALFPRPQRLLTKKSSKERIPHIGKPDADNLAKAIMDALTFAGVWIDDGQVSFLVVSKEYVAIGEAPGADIIIRELP